ncbi:hypothetical protein LCGC14_1851170 [marine sediment metagenome]|uniref:Uncharacterized protein n=1 Tax=marine sediment metagenome TaxID=412755 RepID=A0A0F9GAA0_9ZZZZ
MRLEDNRMYQNQIFDIIVKRALAGERAPQTGEYKSLPPIIKVLAKQGRIKVEVYAHNWRVIEILKGSNAGVRTKEPSGPGAPYLVY